ncbi:ubiquinol-cytochrome C chaperone family protein [Aureimonas sp. AU4]|uniref:ubiquinol-cytochrome C chaperone family protein n=1 Tax=Aureimonas sp. AU4 TaxID=1638163 RepID=UPI000781A4BE|nr:ubiquinol-cytochrome C chaperone family protein [Aureimonas sp. AU4]
MLEAFRRRRRNRDIVERLWEEIVLRARHPHRFEQAGLPDTVLGRFESLGLETFLFVRRCGRDPGLSELSQDVIDRFMTDLDHSMRELGVGYLAVPKRMRKLAGRFYARVRVLEAPLAQGDRQGIADALRATVFRDAEGGEPNQADHLADDLLHGAQWYDRLRSDDILAGRLPRETTEPTR